MTRSVHAPINFSLPLLLVLFVIFFLSPVAVSAQNDDEIINVDSSIVILNAAITDKTGQPIEGLKADQFEVFEDGRIQKIDFFETQQTPFAAVILIDSSGSMDRRLSLARSAAINFLYGLRPEDQVAIYNFDSKVSLIQDFSNSDVIHDRVFDLQAYGWTVMNDAIYEAAQTLAGRPEKRRAIIVLSDGADTKSRRSTDKALAAALEAQATIYTVDMSAIDTGGKQRMQNQGILRKLAGKSGGRFIATPGGFELRNAFKNIVEELGTQYTLGYYPTNLARDGKWRKIELKIAHPDASVRTREGYQALKKEKK